MRKRSCCQCDDRAVSVRKRSRGQDKQANGVMAGESEVKNARDEKEEDEDEEADSPIPIDRGWAWMVVAGTYDV